MEEISRGRSRKILPFEVVAPDLAQRVIGRAERAAMAGAGAFIVPGTVGKAGSAKASDVVQMTCLLVDLDKGDIAAAKSHLEAHLGQPSMTVKSGGLTDRGQHRLHLYWRLSEVVRGPQLARLCELRGLLAEKVGGDPAFASPHQPIRLAGSIYGKSKVRRLVEITEVSDVNYLLYDVDQSICRMPTLPGLPSKRISLDTGRRGPSAKDLQLTKIRSDGRDEVTRFAAIGKVIGHWLHVVRSGRIMLDEAWLRIQEHNAACIDPPWDVPKLRTSFDALLDRDIASHGPMPNFGDLVVSAHAADEDAFGHAHAPHTALLPEAVFLSEDDLADRFVTRFRGEFRFVTARGSWMCWTGKVWKPDEIKKALHQIRSICRVAVATLNDEKLARKLCSERTVSAVEKLSRADPRIAETATAWDRGRLLINTPTGTIDLRTGEQRPHDPGDLLTRITKASPGDGCTRWLQFLDQVTGGKPGLIDYLQRLTGYCMTGSMTEQVFLFLYGTGANGKSIFISTISSILGDYAATAPLDTFTTANGERHPTDLAGLATARAVFVTETENGKPWAESRIKAITGGDTLRVRFLYRDFFEIEPTFKIIVAGNSRPRLAGVGEAMKRRLHLVSFDVTIPLEQREKDLLEQLERERDGIFSWMLAGCAAWQKIGLDPPACVLEAASEYFADEDLVKQWIDEACVVAQHARGRSSLLYKSWAEWADARGFDRGSQRSLGEDLRMRGFEPYRTGRERGWVGLSPQPMQVSTDRAGAA